MLPIIHIALPFGYASPSMNIRQGGSMRLGSAIPAALAALAGAVLAWFDHTVGIASSAFEGGLVAALLVTVWGPRLALRWSAVCDT